MSNPKTDPLFLSELERRARAYLLAHGAGQETTARDITTIFRVQSERTDPVYQIDETMAWLKNLGLGSLRAVREPEPVRKLYSIGSPAWDPCFQPGSAYWVSSFEAPSPQFDSSRFIFSEFEDGMSGTSAKLDFPASTGDDEIPKQPPYHIPVIERWVQRMNRERIGKIQDDAIKRTLPIPMWTPEEKKKILESVRYGIGAPDQFKLLDDGLMMWDIQSTPLMNFLTAERTHAEPEKKRSSYAVVKAWLRRMIGRFPLRLITRSRYVDLLNGYYDD